MLLAKLAGAMKASLTGAALFAAPLSQAVRTVDGRCVQRPRQDGAATPAPAEATPT